MGDRAEIFEYSVKIKEIQKNSEKFWEIYDDGLDQSSIKSPIALLSVSVVNLLALLWIH